MESAHAFLMQAPDDFVVRDVVTLCEPLSKALFEPLLGPLYAPIPAMTIIFFAPIFFLGLLMFTMLGESGFGRMEMTGCVPSFVHGVITLGLSLLQMYQHFMRGSSTMDTDNTASQVMLLQFSCAYFLSDTILYLLPFARHEHLFTLHHLGVFSYMVVSLQLGIGAVSAIAMIAIGESTSPIQNIWFIFKVLRYRHKRVDDVFAYLSWMYAAFYVFIRSALGPNVVIATAWSVYRSKRFPVGVKVYFLTCLLGILLGSQGWSLQISRRLFTNYDYKFGKPRKDRWKDTVTKDKDT